MNGLQVEKTNKMDRNRKNRQWKIFIGIGTLLLVLAVFSYLEQFQAHGNQIPQIGKKISNLSLTSSDGNNVNLSDYRGKVLLINSWATWCPPCKAEMPTLETYYQNNKGAGFEILAINAGESNEVASQFKLYNGITFPIMMDTNGDIIEALGITGLPTSILVNRDGIVEYIHVGMFFENDLENIISPVISRK